MPKRKFRKNIQVTRKASFTKCKLFLALILGLVVGITLIVSEPIVSPMYSADLKIFNILKAEVRDISRDLINQSRNVTQIGKTHSRNISRNGTGYPSEDLYLTAEQLARRVRILCMVLTSPWTKESRAIFINQTWIKRCQKTVFISSVDDLDLPAVGVGVNGGKYYQTQKLLRGIDHVYNSDFKFGEYDWLFIAEDDTYAILENLRYFLKDKNPDDPKYYGHQFHTDTVGLDYVAVGAGVVLGRESLRRLISTKLATCFSQNGPHAGKSLGVCLHTVGAFIGNSTDINGNSRFHFYSTERYIHSYFSEDYLKYEANGAKGGIGHISDYSISFHGLTGVSILELEYYVYHIRAAGVLQTRTDYNQPDLPV